MTGDIAPVSPQGAHAKPMPKPMKKSTSALKLSTILHVFLLIFGQHGPSRADAPSRRPPSSMLSDMAARARGAVARGVRNTARERDATTGTGGTCH